MTQTTAKPVLTRTTVLDLVPFGNAPYNTFFALRLTCPDWDEWRPGQFVMVRKPGAQPDSLWARPFTICRVARDNLVLFFQVAGRETAHLAQLRPGDELDIWGPLGNTLSVEAEGPTLIITGGIGIATFVGYVEQHPAPWNISMLFGHRVPLDCYPLHSVNEKILVDTMLESGPEDLKKFIAAIDERVEQHAAEVKDSSGKGLVLACGPTPFLKTVQQACLKHGAKGQLCLEGKMACGIGACLGCVVKTIPAAKSPSAQEPNYLQTCSCGPNFWADKIVL